MLSSCFSSTNPPNWFSGSSQVMSPRTIWKFGGGVWSDQPASPIAIFLSVLLTCLFLLTFLSGQWEGSRIKKKKKWQISWQQQPHRKGVIFLHSGACYFPSSFSQSSQAFLLTSLQQFNALCEQMASSSEILHMHCCIKTVWPEAIPGDIIGFLGISSKPLFRDFKLLYSP